MIIILYKVSRKIQKTYKFSKITKQCLELSKSFSESYNQGDKFLKIEILKNVYLELFITTKKELKIKENKLFQMIKFGFVPVGGKYLHKYEQILAKLKYVDYKTKLSVIHYFIRTNEGKEFAKKYTTTLQRKYYQIQEMVFEK